MPLTARLRDEENERINNILKRLIALDYVPDLGNDTIDEILKELGLTFDILSNLSPDQLVQHIKKFHFDWENAEQFADFLCEISARESFKLQATVIYKYIQSESKTFSFQIDGKIKSLNE